MRESKFHRKSFAVLLFVAALAVGWVTGGADSHDGNQVAQPVVPERDRPASSAKRMPDAVGKKLAAIRKGATPDERIRAAIAVAEGLSMDELKLWLERGWIDRLGGTEAMVFTRIVQDRWLEEDPEGVIDFFNKKDSGQAAMIAGRWATRDPVAVFEYLGALKVSEMNDQDLIGVALNGIASKKPELALELIEHFGKIMDDNQAWALGEAFGTLAKSQPETLRQTMAGLRSRIRLLAETMLSQVALEQDMASGLEDLAGRENGFDILCRMMGRNEMAGRIIASAEMLPEGWLDRIATGNSIMSYDYAKAWMSLDLSNYGVNEEAAERVRVMSLQNLAGSNPEEFLAKLTSEDFSKKEREALIFSAFHSSKMELGGAQLDQWLGSLTDPEEVKVAEGAIESRRSSIDAGRKRTPAEWITTLAESEHKGGSPYWDQGWDAEGVASALQAFERMEGPEKLATARTISDSGMSSMANPEIIGESIRYNLQQGDRPVGETGPGFMLTLNATQLAHRWTESDPKAASAWASSLPDGEVRRWVVKNVSATWSQYNPAAAAAWARTLPKSDQRFLND